MVTSVDIVDEVGCSGHASPYMFGSLDFKIIGE